MDYKKIEVVVYIDLVEEIPSKDIGDMHYAIATWAEDEDCIKDIDVYQNGRITVTVEGDYQETLEELKEFIERDPDSKIERIYIHTEIIF